MRLHVPALLLALFAGLPVLAETKPTFVVLRIARGEVISYVTVEAAKVEETIRAQVKKADAEIAEWEQDKADFLKKRRGKGFEYPDLSPLPVEFLALKECAIRGEAEAFAKAEQAKADARWALISIRTFNYGKDGAGAWELNQDVVIEAIPMARLRDRETAVRRAWYNAVKAEYDKSNEEGKAILMGQRTLQDLDIPPSPRHPRFVRLDENIRKEEAVARAAEGMKELKEAKEGKAQLVASNETKHHHKDVALWWLRLSRR